MQCFYINRINAIAGELINRGQKAIRVYTPKSVAKVLQFDNVILKIKTIKHRTLT